MGRKIVLAIAWIAYVGLAFVTILWEVTALSYFIPGTTTPPRMVVTAIHVALNWALLLAIPIVVRWKLRNALWGTFAFYAVLLGVALGLRGLEQFLLEDRMVGWTFVTLMEGCLIAAFVLFRMHIDHTKAVLAEARRSNRSSRGR